MPEGFVPVWHNRRTLVVLGPPEPQVLRGRAVSTLLPRLLPLLDGRCSLAEIEERIPGFKPGAVRDAVTLLFVKGLLEEADVEATPEERERFKPQDAWLRFASRCLDLTRVHSNRLDVLRSLASSRVALISYDAAPSSWQEEVVRLGIGSVVAPPSTIAQDPEALASWLGDSAFDLAVVLVDGAGAGPLIANRAALDSHTPCLFVHCGPAALGFGPLVLADQTPCLRCAELQGLLPLEEVGQLNPPERPLAEDLLRQRVSLEVFHFLSRLGEISSTQVIRRLSPDLAFRMEPCHLLASCAECSPFGSVPPARDFAVGPGHRDNFALVYHWNTSEKPWASVPKGFQQHFAESNLEASAAGHKDYLNRTRIALTPPGLHQLPESFAAPYGSVDGRPAQPAQGGSPWVALVGLLYLAAGRLKVEGAVLLGHALTLRPTPSGGGMASQNLYLFSSTIAECPQGLCYFHPNGHLVVVRPGDLGPALDACLPNSGSEGPYARIVVTVSLGRLALKYGAKAYRYALFDAGVMIEALEVLGRSVGFEVESTTEFADSLLVELLDLQGSATEIPLGVVTLNWPHHG